ncbi:hypothetical protein BH09PAT1_BH09PAT1_0590 [soil metagenome]
MTTFLLFAITCLVGFYASKYFSTPIVKDGRKCRDNRLPAIKLGNFEILPVMRIHVKNTTVRLHHWFYLSVFIVGALVLYDNIMHFTTFKVATGASLGSILQGLTYPDRFEFRYPRWNNTKKIG